jgi:hypothetical protein
MGGLAIMTWGLYDIMANRAAHIGKRSLVVSSVRTLPSDVTINASQNQNVHLQWRVSS